MIRSGSSSRDKDQLFPYLISQLGLGCISPLSWIAKAGDGGECRRLILLCEIPSLFFFFFRFPLPLLQLFQQGVHPFFRVPPCFLLTLPLYFLMLLLPFLRFR